MDENRTAAAASPAAPAAVASPPLRPGAPGEAPTSAPEAPVIAPTDAVIEAWWNDHFPGSAVAQVTAAWNVAFAAKEDLKQRLKKGL
jgi:hypothetical protein